MNKKINLSEKLDFNDIDLTEPDQVIIDLIKQISEETSGIILGNIIPYDGHIFSHKKHGLEGLKAALGAADQTIHIQTTLGAQGDNSKKFEFYLSTPSYKQYKYRICYLKYGVSNYPATVVLDQNIINEICPDDSNYVLSCNTRSELEDLFIQIIYSQRVLKVMQELIRINQVQKDLPAPTELSSSETTEKTNDE